MKLKKYIALTLTTLLAIDCGDTLTGGESDTCKEAKSLTILCRLEAGRLAVECSREAARRTRSTAIANLECSPLAIGYQTLCTTLEKNACD